MFFKQFYDNHLSQASYLVGCQRTGEAIVIDPVRDLTKYMEVADSEGFKITQAAETHIHADFASGIRDVQERLNANIYVSGEGDDQLSYKNMPEHTNFVKNQDIIQVGNIKLEVLHTPGHTPESISFLLTDEGGGSSVPMGLFSGDFIFVGDIGRPDLLEKSVQMEGTTEIGAKQMYQSIEGVKNLPDYIQIWPGHGAGSPCGKALGAIPMSTLGYEKINNWAFNVTDESKFVETLTSNQPAPPHHFAQMKKINQFGMNMYQPYDVFPSLDNARIAFDLRSKEAFHGGHTEGTINIPYNQNFINQIGWYLDYENSIDLIGDKSTVEQAAHTLQLIGFDNVAGYRLPKSEILTQSIHSVDMTGKEEYILDVRNEEEWNNGHLDQAVNIPHGKLLNENIPINKEDKIYVHCQSGVRSSIAVGILENKGYENVVNIREGYQDFPESLK
ncbi:persulfide dioxygenase-sulfurtransferase CstB [Staphylococcus saprophyticus]|uniref:persulfide dioxygenase-sulfurtransferase CstB n=1 Tax=Staphylococcus saprophyticus TaxID=29385 RepID=UPI00065A29A3|nr:persulfide dioxygenase-sulfurtransferase CstB [Staphylococcus saprophyticus]CRV28001.1 glyoxylase II family protein [Streptococcus equi subsp. equi]AVK72421.1 MBL fold metallo-hydrolase [Staphylococcus saprophyticus]MCM3120860.1 persulfide dioxygenase-sulfurtransferase CstB [Staphylococcus saprophyticus]MDW3880487.1 persulfide dioxygenase-sulfurtransferase CstB [Staphylococcus saprophyticus]MDW3899801.1 persulfide dioxygenase-sulfurtransferase CstB [Staphylococcus saprophyticus]